VVSEIAVDPSGDRLATGSSDPAIRIWDPRTGRLRGTLPVAADDGPIGLAFGPDGSLAAAFSQGDRVLLYDPGERLRHTFAFEPEHYYPGQVAFSPDGSLLAATVNPRPSDLAQSTVEAADDVDVVVWDTRTYAERARLKLPGQLSMAPAFTHDGRYLLVTANRSVGANGPAQIGTLWRFAAPALTPVDSRDFAEGPVDEIALSPDSATVAVAPGQTAHLLRVDGLTPLRPIGRHTAPLSRVAWSPDGRWLATATDTSDGLILLWDAATGERVGELRGNSNQSGPLRFSPDSGLLIAGLNDWTAAIWRLDPAEAVARLCADARLAGGAPASC
jgi:WD40 repeat protein